MLRNGGPRVSSCVEQYFMIIYVESLLSSVLTARNRKIPERGTEVRFALYRRFQRFHAVPSLRGFAENWIHEAVIYRDSRQSIYSRSVGDFGPVVATPGSVKSV